MQEESEKQTPRKQMAMGCSLYGQAGKVTTGRRPASGRRRRARQRTRRIQICG